MMMIDDDNKRWWRAIPLEAPICEHVRQTLDIGAPKPRFRKGSSSTSIGRDHGKWSGSWSDLREGASVLIPGLQESIGRFAQMEIVHQKLIRTRSRDTLVCERVLGNLTPTPLGVEFWLTKIRFYSAGHRKKIATTTIRICRVITLWCKSEGSKK